MNSLISKPPEITYLSGPQPPPGVVRVRRRRWRRMAVFVLAPTLLSAAYAWFAPPMYVSETRFAVRAAEVIGEAGKSGAGGLLGSFGAASAFAVDGFALRDFLQSPDALGQLDADGAYRAKLSANVSDPLNRLAPDADDERTFRFYSQNTDVRFSLTEQILTVRVFAYSPADATSLADAMIGISERFTNRLNERARSDALQLAQGEVTIAEKRVAGVRAQMHEWRTRNAHIDPAKSIEAGQAIINDLRKSLAEAQTQYAVVSGRLNPNSPQMREFTERIRSLQQQINREQEKLTGAQGSTATLIGEYERLVGELDFATRQLASVQQSLEQARIAVIRQTKYVAVIVRPTVPKTPSWPAPVKIVGGVFAASLMAYLIALLIGRTALDSMR